MRELIFYIIKCPVSEPGDGGCSARMLSISAQESRVS